MSYEIIYRKAAVRLNENEVLVFGEIGSSNCYEHNYNGRAGRRARGFNTIPFGVNETPFILNVKTYKDDFDKFAKNKFDNSKIKDAENDANGQSKWNDNYTSVEDINYSYYTAIYLRNKMISIDTAKRMATYLIKNAKSFDEVKDKGFFFLDAENNRINIRTLEQLTDRARQNKHIYLSRFD